MLKIQSNTTTATAPTTAVKQLMTGDAPAVTRETALQRCPDCAGTGIINRDHSLPPVRCHACAGTYPDHPFAPLVRYKGEGRPAGPLLALAESILERCPTRRRIDYICSLNLAAEKLLTPSEPHCHQSSSNAARQKAPQFVEGIVGNVPEALRRAKAAGRSLWLWCEPAQMILFARPCGAALWANGEDATPLSQPHGAEHDWISNLADGEGRAG